ncbi:uncharacterized protein AMSG_11728 [Thecamonas trahens ATCC 50062]|uniref:Uncharacterized protein n=1 Tax=Thecamonas trahens ATCC 50062 TaxID=461836 RepID=A0A0L0D5I3_THETB|nr:hypothetical protein AMSG_11728 [Thecamonas trahens ATCC 50062]KNC47627.1 hypothetical protein AMSG_11728 [Thecamonas trahens ATCC 50062]|eukprot:XP_013759572.1 hypothetical protein AMSG_11728 [Thecamonas trahens ATCC 50062]
MLASGGWIAVKNRTFSSLSIICLGQWFVSCAAWAVVILVVLYFDDFMSSSVVVEVFVGLATHMFRSALVAVKHGWRKPSLVRAVKAGVVPRRQLRLEEIISGWIVLGKAVTLTELSEAAIRHDLNLQGYLVRVAYTSPSAIREELPLACEALPEVGEQIRWADDNAEETGHHGTVLVPLHLVLAETLLVEKSNRLPFAMLVIRLVSSLVVAGTLPAARLAFGQAAFGDTWPTQVALSLVVLIQLGITFNFTSLVVFASWADSFRRTRWLRTWGGFLFDRRSLLAPFFSRHPEVWLLSRRVILDIGLQFRKRLDVFFAAMLLLIGSLIVPIVVLSLRNEQSTSVAIFFAFSLVMGSVATTALILSSIAGYSTNQTFRTDQYALHGLALDPMHGIRGLGARLEYSISGLHLDATLNSLTILGLSHGPAAFRAILSFGLAVISISLRQLFFGI